MRFDRVASGHYAVFVRRVLLARQVSLYVVHLYIVTLTSKGPIGAQ